MNRFSLLAFFFTCSISLSCQGDRKNLFFEAEINKEKLVLSKNYFLQSSNDSVKVEVLKFYISDLELLENGKIIYSAEKKYCLMDWEDENTLKIRLKKINDGHYNRIKFVLGIDSATNVSGAMGGDLDPSKNMYWTWQSGYINFKLEGKSNVCKTRNHAFQFHIGGYQYPYSTIQSIVIQDFSGDTVKVSLDKFFANMNIAETPEVMSPNEKAVKTAHIFSLLFK